MKNQIFAIAFATLVLAPGPVVGQSSGRSVAGAASGSLPADAMLGGIPVGGVDLGTGVIIEADGSASGWFHAVLNGSVLGVPKRITVEVKITQGGVAADGSVSFSGSGTLDLGDGTPAVPVGLLNVTAGDAGLVLSIDAATLPVQVTSGVVAIE
jgi:hypothetical protein